MGGDDGGHGAIQARNRGRHLLGFPQPRRAFDVGQKQRHHSRRQNAHAQIAPLQRRVRKWVRLAHASQHALATCRNTSANTRRYRALPIGSTTPGRAHLRALTDGLRPTTAHSRLVATRGDHHDRRPPSAAAPTASSMPDWSPSPTNRRCRQDRRARRLEQAWAGCSPLGCSPTSTGPLRSSSGTCCQTIPRSGGAAGASRPRSVE